MTLKIEIQQALYDLEDLLDKNKNLKICKIENTLESVNKKINKSIFREGYYLIDKEDCISFLDQSILPVYFFDVGKYVNRYDLPSNQDKDLEIYKASLEYIRTSRIEKLQVYTKSELISEFNILLNEMNTLKTNRDLTPDYELIRDNLNILNEYLTANLNE